MVCMPRCSFLTPRHPDPSSAFPYFLSPQMVQYCETLGCRRQRLLEYFGESVKDPIQFCGGNCDVCVDRDGVQESLLKLEKLSSRYASDDMEDGDDGFDEDGTAKDWNEKANDDEAPRFVRARDRYHAEKPKRDPENVAIGFKRKHLEDSDSDEDDGNPLNAYHRRKGKAAKIAPVVRQQPVAPEELQKYIVLDKGDVKQIPDLKLEVREKCAKLLLETLKANFAVTSSTQDPKTAALRIEHAIFKGNSLANIYKMGISHKISEVRRLTSQNLPMDTTTS